MADLALMGVVVDTWRVYSGDDPDYLLWLEALADRVQSARRAMMEQRG